MLVTALLTIVTPLVTKMMPARGFIFKNVSRHVDGERRGARSDREGYAEGLDRIGRGTIGTVPAARLFWHF